jgi:hypothetical protein
VLDLMCEPPPGGGRLTSLARPGRAKRTLPGRFSGPTVYQALLSGPSVILPDDHKQALCTAPNARPLSSVVAGKCKLNHMDAVAARLMHNHPSGDPTPSQADVQMTKEIVAVAQSLGISVHDHIIVGKDGHAGLKSLRLMSRPTPALPRLSGCGADLPF